MTDLGLAKLARIAQEDAENGESSQDEVVVHMRKNLNGTELYQTCGEKELRTIGQKTLHDGIVRKSV